jgi:hypothetical protein
MVWESKLIVENRNEYLNSKQGRLEFGEAE